MDPMASGPFSEIKRTCDLVCLNDSDKGKNFFRFVVIKMDIYAKKGGVLLSLLFEISEAHPTYASCYLISLTYDLIPGKKCHRQHPTRLGDSLNPKRENLMSEGCAKGNPLNAIFKWKAMRMSLQFILPLNLLHLLSLLFFSNFSRLPGEWKKWKTMPKIGTMLAKKKGRVGTKRSAWLSGAPLSGWWVSAVPGHCRV